MTYTYECPICGKFTVEKSINDNSITKCKCGLEVKRVYAPINSIWKTGGACGKVGK